ncbi:MAG: ribonuclease H-like domain-containing protein [bacterium]|nr:ribonuclease H-like domain-containing protein [bacterium]
MDKLVIDIETKNSFADVGGQQNIKDLKVSLVGVFSYEQNKYLSFNEYQVKELNDLLKKTGLIIGFSINRFDIPVLNEHCGINLFNLSRIDLLDEIEILLGQRISLDILAKTNLNTGKTHSSGLEAIRLYKEGKFDELRDYCLNDVKITKDLYELTKKQGHLLVPHRTTGEMQKAHIHFDEPLMPQSLF